MSGQIKYLFIFFEGFDGRKDNNEMYDISRLAFYQDQRKVRKQILYWFIKLAHKNICYSWWLIKCKMHVVLEACMWVCVFVCVRLRLRFQPVIVWACFEPSPLCLDYTDCLFVCLPLHFWFLTVSPHCTCVSFSLRQLDNISPSLSHPNRGGRKQRILAFPHNYYNFLLILISIARNIEHDIL